MGAVLTADPEQAVASVGSNLPPGRILNTDTAGCLSVSLLVQVLFFARVPLFELVVLVGLPYLQGFRVLLGRFLEF